MPWLLYNIIYSEPYEVNSTGMLCSVMLLFGMLVIVIVSIAACRWRMTRQLGGVMFGLYGVFLVLSLLLAYEWLECPELD